MRKFALILLLFALVAGFLPYAPALAQSPPQPHEDPAVAKAGALDAYALLVSYRDVLQLLSAEDYADASKAIEKLQYVSLPADIKLIADRFNDLLGKLNTALESANQSLTQATSLLSELKLAAALEKLEEGERSLRYAEDLLQYIQDSLSRLVSHPLIAALAAPAESKLREVYQSLTEMLGRLENLWRRYDAAWQSLNSQTEEIQKIESVPTLLTLELSSASAWVGDSVIARGKLTSPQEEIPLPDREIGVKLGENSFTTTTVADGSYQVELAVPYLYVRGIDAQAFYAGGGDKYQPSRSNTVSLQIFFYQTEIEITAPEKNYPGWTTEISGSVTTGQEKTPLEDRTVGIFLDNQPVATAATNSAGSFRVSLVLAPQLSTGEHTLRVTVEPQGKYTGVSEEKTLKVLKVMPGVQLPGLVSISLTREIHLKGKVNSPLSPLQGAQVTLEIKGITATTQTSPEGGFATTLKVPLGTILFGLQKVKVDIDSPEPWHLPVQEEIPVFVFDLVNIGLVSLALLSLGAVVYARRRERIYRGGVEPRSALPEEKLAEEKLHLELKARRGEEAERNLLYFYWQAAREVERVTRVSYLPPLTLREFLERATPKLGEAATLFSRLTQLAETALYSPYGAGAVEVSQAESLALQVKGLLQRLSREA